MPTALIQRLLVVLVLLGILPLSACSRAEQKPLAPNAPVFIISIDTLRADHLPLFGYEGVETPHMDRLRADGILFTSAWAHAPLTLPSHVSLLTGTLPGKHGVRNNIGYRFVGDTAVSLPGVLGANGYATGASVSAYVLRGATGLSGMFEFYDDAIASRAGTPVGALQREGDRSRLALEAWIDSNRHRPHMAMLHLFEPHAPYAPPEPHASRYASEPYDGEIAAVDAIVGRFIDELKDLGLYERSLIVLLSDHGEGLGDHGEPEHGVFLYREAIHVPLIVKLPANTRGGETVERPVGLIDVAPTILGAVGIPVPSQMSGVDLLQPDPADADSRVIYSETFFPRIHLGWSELRSLVDARHHYIEGPDPELYDMKSDPHETRNVLRESRRTYASLRDAMAPFRAEAVLPNSVDPEEAKSLVALGYLGSIARDQSGPRPDPKSRIGVIALMSDAMFLVSQSRHGEAIPKLRAITATEPGMTDAWNQLALSLESVGSYEEAATAYRTAIELTPALAGEFGLSLGAILLKMGRLDEAEQHAALAEKVNPSGYHMLRARVAFARQDWTSAEREARAAMAEPVGATAASVLLARILAQQGNLEAGLTLVESIDRDAREKGLGPVESLEYARGDLLARMNRLDEAEAAFRREIALFPYDRLAYSALAILYRMRGDTANMRRVIGEMAKASPSKATYQFAAHSLEQLDDPDEAAKWKLEAKRAHQP